MNDIQIRYADDSDLPYLIQNDSLVTEEIIKKKLSDRQVIVSVDREFKLGSDYRWPPCWVNRTELGGE